MKRATVVIGANYGDEGKGKTVDALCARYGSDTTVVRFSGGANAGHTVELDDGRRHVFGHIGSGALADCRTFLSRDFIVNPILFKKERHELITKGVEPVVVADPCARVTTPYDVFINQEIERARGGSAHGSCGVGINETVARSEALWGDFRVTAADLCAPSALSIRLEGIRDNYLPRRMNELGLTADMSKLATPFEYAERMTSAATGLWFYGEDEVFKKERPVVFEGSQGLGLDEYYGEFPYVTRARTGLANVVPMARRLGIAGLDIIYLTRSYATRHGSGPFPEFLQGLWFEDKTNVHNEFQGSLRFGHLDVQAMAGRIKRDLKHCAPMDPRVFVGISCMDQFNRIGLEDEIRAATGAEIAFTSDGPTRNDINWKDF